MNEVNGYVIASQEITKGITAAFANGSTLDEVFAALKVQAEVLNVRLAQAVLHQQQVEAMQAHQAAKAEEASLEGTEENAN